MQKELERKYKITNIGSLRNTIIKLGAKFLGSSCGVDLYFKIPQKIERTKYLRIRTKEKEKNGTLAYHEVVDNFTTKEWEIEISDKDIAKDIIQKIGFPIDVIVKKEREKYLLDRVEVVLDKINDLGSFVEVESPTVELLKKTINRLRLQKKDIISGAGYPDLLKEKNAAKIK